MTQRGVFGVLLRYNRHNTAGGNRGYAVEPYPARRIVVANRNSGNNTGNYYGGKACC